MRFPVAVEEISAKWVTEALQQRYAGARVRGVTTIDQMHGTASKVRIRLEYDPAGKNDGLPATMIVKGGFNSHRELMYREYMLETRFYAELAPRLQDVRVPHCFFAGRDDCKRQAIVLLEDLDAVGATFCRVQRTLSFEQAVAHLRMLASLHAQWWLSVEFSGGRSLEWADALDPFPEGQLGAYQRSRIQPDVYAQCMSLPRGAAVSRRFHDRDRMERALELLREVDSDGPFCLLHTDPHLGNLYLDEQGRPGILDWQSVRRGPWAHDLNYFLVSSLDVLDRREWEQALLRAYLDSLRTLGARPPVFADAWLAYRKQSVYGLYYWLVNPIEFQVEVNNCAVAPRFALAAMDHDTFALLGA